MFDRINGSVCKTIFVYGISALFLGLIILALIMFWEPGGDESKTTTEKIMSLFVNDGRNKQGFYFNKPYIIQNEPSSTVYIVYNSNESESFYVVLHEDYYNQNKADIDKKLEVSNYNAANKKLNKQMFGNELGKSIKVTYGKLKVTEANNPNPYYFSDDGKTIYKNQNRTEVFGVLAE